MILKEIIKKTNLISNRVVIEETNCIQLLYKSRLTIIGGFTGLIDTILHDSYFIIGHLHYVLSLGAIYTISAAFYTYWVFFTTISFSDYLGRIHSSSFFISTNSISFTMHSLGIIGFPRRIYDYSMIFFKFQWFNSLGLIGIYLSIIILLFTFYPLFWLFKVIGVLLQFPCCRQIFI